MCMLSLTGVYPDEIGSTILLTRLEHGSTPFTVRIPTADRKVHIYLCADVFTTLVNHLMQQI